MKRFINIFGKIQIKRYNPNSWSLDIEITNEDIVPFFMELQLLDYKRADTVTIMASNTSECIVIKVPEKSVAASIELIDKKYQVKLSQREIGAISAYILEYYRDSYAPVSHIDIELSHSGKLGKDATLIIRTNNAAEPMTGEEAKRLLGIE